MSRWDWTRVTLGGMASLAILLGSYLVASTGEEGNVLAGFVLITVGSLLLGAWIVDRVYRDRTGDDKT